MIKKSVESFIDYKFVKAIQSIQDMQQHVSFRAYCYHANCEPTQRDVTDLLHEYSVYIDGFFVAIKTDFYLSVLTPRIHLYKALYKEEFQALLNSYVNKLHTYLETCKENLLSQTAYLLQLQTETIH